MTHVVGDICVKDDSCLAVCPVDCIVPHLGDLDFDSAEQLYIDPETCIDCGTCVTACPVGAIYADFDAPLGDGTAIERNAAFCADRDPLP